MKQLSIRDEPLSSLAGIETPSGGGGVGISTSARKFWRKHFAGVTNMLGTNDQVNYLIALDFSGATPIHRFILNSGEPAVIAKSNSFFYIGVVRKNGRQDVIVMQPSYKEPSEQVKKQRMTQEWLEGVMSGKIQRKSK